MEEKKGSELYEVPFGYNAKIRGKDNRLVTSLNTFDDLEYDCWHLIEKYAEKFDLEILPEDPEIIEFDFAKRVQDKILEIFEEAGFKFVPEAEIY